MILQYSRLGADDVAIQVAAQVPAAAGAVDPNIWPFVKAGVISGLTVYFLTKWLNGGKR